MRRRSSFEALQTTGWLLLFALSSACNSAEAPAPAEAIRPPNADPKASALPPGVQVDPSLIEQGRITLTPVQPVGPGTQVTLPGDVIPTAAGEAEVGSLTSGRVAQLDATQGDPVSKGQILAWIDSKEVGAVRADLMRARAQVLAATRRLERQRTLQAQAATSQSAVEDAETAVITASADQQAAEARLAAMGAPADGRGSGRIPIRSPIAGVITERHAVLGAAVFPDGLLFRVVASGELRVHAYWSEAQGKPPAIGTHAILVPRQHRTKAVEQCEAKVAGQLGFVANDTRSLTLRLDPTSACPLLTPGGYVDVIVTQGETDEPATAGGRVQVPLEALVDVRGVPTVFVAGASPGHFEARSVSPGSSLGAYVAIESGLRAGERVASRGVLLLKGEMLRDLLGGD
jgi:membrane fusion protein, heavy metal efflux system